MSKTFRVRMPDGTMAKRTSQTRNYTHAVIAQRSLSQDRINCENSERAYWRNSLKWRQELVAGTAEGYGRRYDFETQERYEARLPERQKHVDEARAALERGEQSFVDAALASFDKSRSGRPDTYYEVLCWCGRPDLAAKEVSKARSWIIRAFAVEVQMDPPRAGR